MGEEKLKALLQESLAVDDDPPDRRAGADSNELREFEDRIRSRLPNLQNLAALGEVTRQLEYDKGSLNREPIYVICPVRAA